MSDTFLSGEPKAEPKKVLEFMQYMYEESMSNIRKEQEKASQFKEIADIINKILNEEGCIDE